VFIYPENTIEELEFSRIREEVEQYCRVPESKEMAHSMAPIKHHESLMNTLHETEELMILFKNKAPFPDSEFVSISREVSLLQIQGSVLTEQQFTNIRNVAVTANHLLVYFENRSEELTWLNGLCANIYKTTVVADAINKIIEEHEPYVKSSASKELYEIRKDLSAKRRESEKKFKSFLNEMKRLGWLRESEESFYNGRRVIAVMAEYKREVKGIIHGSSETGKTSFVEPVNTVEINNEIVSLEQAEKKEVFKLLRSLTDELRAHKELVKGYNTFLCKLDFTRAKAKFAVALNCILPEISSQPELHLIKAYHPVLFLKNKKSGKRTEPITLRLDKQQRILIISGPNAGGKSITLKTAGLLQLMLQSGMPVPLQEGSKMGLFQHLFTDIGDSQSIEYELSTYSSRLLKAKYFLTAANRRSLILIDELGTGSDPDLGGAIAEAIMEELLDRNAICLVTTHYTNIKMLAENRKGIVNACMQFDAETLLPRYILEVGKPGSSYTFEVAEKIGLPEHIIQNARKKVNKGKLKFDSILAGLQKEQQEFRAMKLQLEKEEGLTQEVRARLEKTQEKINRKLDADREKADEASRLIALGKKMQDLTLAADKGTARKEVVAKFMQVVTAEKRKKMEKVAAEKDEKRKKKKVSKVLASIEVGSKVRLMNGGKPGIVESIHKGKVRVIFGSIKSVVALENLVPC
jgi:DNA mismatch repair protein MutS2